MSGAEILQAAAAAEKQGVVFFLTAFAIVMILVGIWIGRWFVAQLAAVQKKADDSNAAFIAHLTTANTQLVETVNRNNDLVEDVKGSYERATAVMVRLEDELKRADRRGH